MIYFLIFRLFVKFSICYKITAEDHPLAIDVSNIALASFR